MEIFAFLLIGGIWAAFLLPSFFESRRRGPLNTTRNFARSQGLLATVSATNSAELKARRRAAMRRRRVLLVLTIGALGSLALAVLQGSLLWLGMTIVFDLALAAYLTLLLQVRTTRAHSAPIVPFVAAESTEDAQHHTVRVVAG